MNTKVMWNGPCNTLIEGICRQAEKDYLSKGKSEYAEYWRNDARQFFLSGWFYELTGLDGKRILDMLDELQ